MERNFLLTIEYDGSEFSGWQRQPDRRTVQGELERALSKVCGGSVQINGSSRTDAGVHGLGARASFRGEYGIPTDRLKLAANNILAGGKNLAAQVGDVRILDVQEMPLEFHARFDAKGKKYIYNMYIGVQNPFYSRYMLHLDKMPDIDLMNKFCKGIIGTHDFAGFSSSKRTVEDTVRTITHCQVTVKDNKIYFEIKGDGFLYNMVRILAGTALAVGQHRLKYDCYNDVFKCNDRTKAGDTLPAFALILDKVYF